MSFEVDVSRIARRMKVRAEDLVTEATKEVFRSVVKDTPVDTGRAQGNWQCSTEAPATTPFVEQFGEDAPVADINQTVAKPGLFFLTNNLPYIERLEYGYSKKAKFGMVRKNARRIRSILAKEARKA